WTSARYARRGLAASRSRHRSTRVDRDTFVARAPAGERTKPRPETGVSNDGRARSRRADGEARLALGALTVRAAGSGGAIGGAAATIARVDAEKTCRIAATRIRDGDALAAGLGRAVGVHLARGVHAAANLVGQRTGNDAYPIHAVCIALAAVGTALV